MYEPIFIATKISAFDDKYNMKTLIIYLDGSIEVEK